MPKTMELPISTHKSCCLEQIWPEWASGGSFGQFWLPGARYGQNEPQEPYFEHFGCLAPDMARMSLRRLILSILVAWCQIWPEWASRTLFWAFAQQRHKSERFNQNLSIKRSFQDSFSKSVFGKSWVGPRKALRVTGDDSPLRVGVHMPKTMEPSI